MRRPAHLSWFRSARLIGLAVSFALCVCAGARAFAPRILLVAAPGVSRALQEEIERTLSALGEILPSAEYRAATRSARLHPTSPAALTQVAPRMYASVIVVVAVKRGKLVVTWRDGRSGQEVAGMRLQYLTLHGHRLSNDARQQLMAAGQYALSVVEPGGGMAPAPEQAPAPQPGWQAQQPQAGWQMQPQPQQPQYVPMQPAPPIGAQPYGQGAPPSAAPEQPPPFESPAQEQPEAGPPGQEAAAQEPLFAEGRTLWAVLGAGPGLGSRSVQLPTREGLRSLGTSLFPAIDVSLALHTQLSRQWLLTFAAHYQTSLGVHATQQPVDGAAKKTSLRTHHLDFGLAPGLRFGSTRNSVMLSLFAGWALRGLRAVVDIDIPNYTLHGPVLRPELRIPIADEAAVFRIAPELIYIAKVGSELRDAGNTSASGLAYGGEVALELRLARLFYVIVSYRESHASLATVWAADFKDVERFATARAALYY